jgi:hypothetical protein
MLAKAAVGQINLAAVVFRRGPTLATTSATRRQHTAASAGGASVHPVGSASLSTAPEMVPAATAPDQPFGINIKTAVPGIEFFLLGPVICIFIRVYRTCT